MSVLGGDVLIVGAGQAGVQLACSLRDGGFTGGVTLVGEDPHPPYQRPPLSKAYLKREVGPESLALRALDFYAARRIDLVLGDRVTAVRRNPDGSGEAHCASGRCIPFATLVLATGARPRELPMAGADTAGIHVLRGIDHADALAVELEAAEDVVIVGGGFIGLEIAATARAQGRTVTVLEAAPTLMGRAVGPMTAAHILERHLNAGIDIRLATRPTRLLVEAGRVAAVEASPADTCVGEVLPAQLVVVGIGAQARTDLAESLGLACENGIVVDGRCLASDGLTLAIGDCAARPDPTVPGHRGSRIRLESVDNAIEHAKLAAATILGEEPPAATVPWFWSDQGDVKLQIVGLRRPTDTPVVRGPDGPGRLVVGYYREGRLAAVEAVNAPADFMALKKALAAGVSCDPADLADSAVSLKPLLKAVAADAVSPR